MKCSRCGKELISETDKSWGQHFSGCPVIQIPNNVFVTINGKSVAEWIRNDCTIAQQTKEIERLQQENERLTELARELAGALFHAHSHPYAWQNCMNTAEILLNRIDIAALMKPLKPEEKPE